MTLDRLQWKRGRGYDVAELIEFYTRSREGVEVILEAVREKVPDPLRMRALGFCVSVDNKPEMAVRGRLYARGLRYRVCFRVPGQGRRTIDIAFIGARLAVYIDGCF